jgi:basic membrane lipoprotein Med (substrate-binding protein (PBP1-ABC) superfamily)
VRRSIGNFNLVLLAGQLVDARFVGELARHPRTRFVFLDPDPSQTAAGLYAAVSNARNATDIFFVEGPAAFEAGYVGALMAKRRDLGKRPVVISLIAGDREVNENEVAGFSIGAKAAVPGATVLEDYSHDFTRPTVCARIANRQFDRGSTVVFADAGACSAGALAAAGGRGVWGIGANQDMSNPEPQILGSTVKRLDRAVDFAIRSYLEGALPQGHLDIGIARGDVGFDIVADKVPAGILAKLGRARDARMKTWASFEMPLECDREVGSCGGGQQPPG